MSYKTSYDSSAKIWSGLEKISNPHFRCSVGQTIFANMKNNPQNICQISDTDGISFTNEEMLTMSIRIAQHLEKKENSIIGIMAASSTYQAPVLLAAWLNGTVFHPICSSSDKKTIQHVFGISRPKIVFCDADNYETLIAACEELNLSPMVYTIKGQVEGVSSVHELMTATGNEDTFSPQNCKEDDTTVIMCSSGTTGLPKGVCISNLGLLNMLAQLSSELVILACGNVDWITSLLFLLYSCVFCVTRICTVEQFSPQKLRQLIEKYKISMVMMPGCFMSQFVKSGEAELCDCSSLQMFVVGGGNVSHPMYLKMQDYLNAGIVLNIYGGTEFGSVTMNSTMEKPRSVGQLNKGFKVRIVDDDGTNLGIGETGEILVWNGQHWNGYYRNLLETQNMIDSNGWFHTGDLGCFDEDGDLHLVDRKKEIMKYKGYHYSAQEIENCILALNDIAEVCVFSTRVDEFEDLATAAVIKKSESTITEDEIKKHVASKLSESKWLHGGVYFTKIIPKTSSGKYQRSKTRDMCLAVLNNKNIELNIFNLLI